MVVPESGGELSAALVNAVLLALWAALPGLIVGYIRQVLAARKIRPEFALRKSEIAELDRAVTLYDQVCRRLETIERQTETPTRFWRALFDRTDDVARCRRTRRPAGARPAFAGDDRALEAPAAAAAARLGSRRQRAIGLGRRHCGLWRGACARHRRVASARPGGLGGRIERRRAPCACLVSARRALVLRQRGRRRLRRRRRRVVLSAAPRAAAPRLRA